MFSIVYLHSLVTYVRLIVTEEDPQIETFSKLVELFLVLQQNAQSSLPYYNHIPCS